MRPGDFLVSHTPGKNIRVKELEVALAAFRKNKERPRIFIYFKEEGIEDEALTNFKQYCEHTLGHFCDVYTTPEDWRVNLTVSWLYWSRKE